MGRMTDRKLLTTMRIVTLVFTLLVTLYAINSEASIFEMVEQAYQVTLVSAFVPLLCGIYWQRATNQGALCSVFCGVVVWISVHLFGPEDPFVPAQLAGLIASAVGMLAGSLMPQFVHHDPRIHHELRYGHLAHPAATHGLAHEGIGPIHHHDGGPGHRGRQ
jgi:Na+/proline symporter